MKLALTHLLIGGVLVFSHAGLQAAEPEAAPAEMTTRQLIEATKLSIVRIHLGYKFDKEVTKGEGAEAKKVVEHWTSGGSGTGFIVPGGYIVTNHHVVTPRLDKGETLTALEGYEGTFAFDTRLPPVGKTAGRPSPFAEPPKVDTISPSEFTRGKVALELIASDWRLDIAVLRIDMSSGSAAELVAGKEGGRWKYVLDLMEKNAVKLGPPEELQVGDDVVAVGFPNYFTGPPSVTKGIVSALEREYLEQNLSFTNLVQTDAPINPGNSGGPLFDMKGRVVGINTLSLNHLGWPGMCFARGMRTAAPAIQMLIKGPIVRPDLGIRTYSVSEKQQDVLGSAPGLLILGVEKASLAEEAGVLPGDLLVQIGGEPVSRLGDLNNALALHGQGETMKIVVWRFPAPILKMLVEGGINNPQFSFLRIFRSEGAVDLQTIQKLNLTVKLK